MKQYINEAYRLQRLAGLLTESEYSEAVVKEEEQAEVDPEVDSAMKAALSTLGDVESLDEIQEEEHNLSESIVGLVGSGVLAAPKLLSWIGKAIGFISKAFKGKDESSIANSIESVAHKWEGLYLKAITAGIKATGLAKSVWKKEDGSIDQEKLKIASKIVYAIILALAAGNALKTVLSPETAIIRAIEGSLGGVKAVEISQIASKLKGKI